VGGDDGPVSDARIGLVLGAGGVAGGAWHAGALAALAERTGWDVRTADVVVGTSAGSIAGAGLRSGLSAFDEWDLAVGPQEGAPFPRLRAPRPVPANPLLGLRGMVRRVPRPGIAMAGLLPAGVLSTETISARIDGLFGAGGASGAWPADAALWVVAVDLASGRRVVFGRDDIDAPVRVGEAVAASCAVPSFFAPVTIGGRAYVDGGVHSPTNADLVAGLGLDLVIVSAPMAGRWRSLRPHPAALSRTAARVALDREVASVRRSGTPVLVLQPGPDDTPMMDGRSMDPTSRVPIAHQARASVAASLARDAAAPLLALL
jgi:NTE family protein